MRGLFKDAARYWRSPLLKDAELLTAEFHDHVFCPHWHDGFVIAVIEAGAQGYRYRGARRIAGARETGVIHPGEVHTGERAVEEGWAYRVFYPSADWMQRLAGDLEDRMTREVWFPDHVITDQEVAERLLRAHRLLEGREDPLLAETALFEAFTMLLRRHARSRLEGSPWLPDDPRVKAMKEILSSNLSQAVTLSDMALAVNLSPFHAARLFSRSVGMPPHAWRNQARLHRAVALLRKGMPVTRVALECGFTDQSHLTKFFRRAYGVPPGRWQAA